MAWLIDCKQKKYATYTPKQNSNKNIQLITSNVKKMSIFLIANQVTRNCQKMYQV